MKTIKLIFIFLFFYSNAFSQSYIDYTEVRGLIFKESASITADFIKQTTEKNNKKGAVNRFLEVVKQRNRLITTYDGKRIFRKCVSLERDISYMEKSLKRRKEGLLDDKKEMRRARTDYLHNLYVTRYNNGLKHYKNEVKEYNKAIRDIKLCTANGNRKSDQLTNKFNSLKSELGRYYLKKFRDKEIADVSKKINGNDRFLQTETIKWPKGDMKWHKGDVNSLLKEIKNQDKIGFLFIYNNSNECKEAYKDYFIKSPSGGFSSSTDVVEIHNKHFISGKYTIDEVAFVNKNLKLPAFIWINSKGDMIDNRTSIDTNVKYFSEKIIEELYSEITNFDKNRRAEGCNDIFCRYTALHRVFMKTPNSRKGDELYQLLESGCGGLQSVELKWLLNYPYFEEESYEIKMNILYGALVFSYMKETGDYDLTEAFNSYANDKLIKPLGKYATAFKKYLIEEGEGKGFESTNIDRTLEIKKYDNGNIKSKGYKSKKNGRRIGKWVYYYKSGKKKQELNLDENQKIIGIGLVYYEDGKIYRTATQEKGTSNENQTYYYKNGVIKSKGKRDYYSQDKTGLWKVFDEKGRLTSEGEYKNEIKIGKWTYYRNNGAKALIEEYNYISSAVRKGLISLSNDKRGITRKTFFYPNGKIHSVEDFKKNTLWRVISRFSSNGTEKVKDGTGIYEVYYNSQQKNATSEVKNGMRHGITKWYYRNGQLKQSALYKYDKNSDFLGLRWEILSMFDKNGNQREKGSLKNGNGTWFGYDDNGFLIRQTKYKNGKKVDR